ncbi:MAG TPA: serine/threonine-protein kinase [Polyangia bacterium]|jgi:serine/threonine-protein kinase
MIAPDARSGTTVGKYRLHEIVGRGGMGVVYRAEHVYIGREVAVKILHEGYGAREDSIKRFLREARAASLINHPNIVEVTDFGKSTDGTVFFVMELLVGEPLDAVLARDRRLALLRSITICNQLAAALGAAHSKGIIHRDLKPENVMLIPREGRRELLRRVNDDSGAHEISERETQFDFVKILDFGVAKVREPDAQKGRVTQAGVVFGTPEYMAPETARIGFSDARSDIYALGVMFFEMLTGVVPFTGEAPVDVMMKQVNERVPRMHDVAPEAEITDETETMIRKALAKDPEQRQQSMEEFHRDLQKCYGQLRFRRTVKTPTTQAPAVAAIPLTKKKLPPAGEIPNGIRLTPSVSIELEPAVQAAPAAGAATPILLTKKKVPAAVIAVKAPDPQPKTEAAPASGQKKRNTLPLGLQGQSPLPAPVELVETTSRFPGPGRLNGREKTAMGGHGAERQTPRVSMPSHVAGNASERDGELDPAWQDEPTAPGASGGRP